jgi:hypothetical protein
MDYKTNVRLNKYDEYVSIGNKCPTAITLKNTNKRTQSYPFDWIPILPKQVLMYIKNNFTDFIPEKGIINKENIWFGHFDLTSEIVIETINRRIKRLYDLFQSDKKVLFIYTSEADIYNEMQSRTNEKQNYNDILEFRDYLLKTYPKLNFDILVVNMNTIHNDEKNIYNVTITVDDKYISDNMETHVSWCYNEYRKLLNVLFYEVL